MLPPFGCSPVKHTLVFLETCKVMRTAQRNAHEHIRIVGNSIMQYSIFIQMVPTIFDRFQKDSVIWSDFSKC